MHVLEQGMEKVMSKLEGVLQLGLKKHIYLYLIGF